MTNSTQTLAEVFGDPIATYTVDDALNDGSMIAADPQLCREAGFLLPVVFTVAAWHDLVAWDRDDALNDETGRLWDVLNMCRSAARRGQPGRTSLFGLLRVPNRTSSGALSRAQHPAPASGYVTVQAMDVAGSRGCVTIMLAEDL